MSKKSIKQICDEILSNITRVRGEKEEPKIPEWFEDLFADRKSHNTGTSGKGKVPHAN